MTAEQRREQLIGAARGLFAEYGLGGTTVEEIAAAAQVSKPVVYEHFGGKQGLYAAVADHELRRLDDAVKAAIGAPGLTSRQIIERGALALLDYIEDCPEGFRIISRDSSVAGSFASLMSDVARNVEDILCGPLTRRGFDAQLARPFSQALVGLVAAAGQVWLDTRQPSKRELATQLTNLAWNGLLNLEPHPTSSLLDEDQPTSETIRS